MKVPTNLHWNNILNPPSFQKLSQLRNTSSDFPEARHQKGNGDTLINGKHLAYHFRRPNEPQHSQTDVDVGLSTLPPPQSAFVRPSHAISRLQFRAPFPICNVRASTSAWLRSTFAGAVCRRWLGAKTPWTGFGTSFWRTKIDSMLEIVEIRWSFRWKCVFAMIFMYNMNSLILHVFGS